MNCDKAERLLPLLGRGDLKSKSARALQKHLANCATCAESADDYQRFFDLVHSTAAVEFDDEFFRKIRRSVLSEIRVRENRRPTPLLWWRAKPVTVLAIVVLMTALGAGIAFLNRQLTANNNEIVARSTESSTADQPQPAVATTNVDVGQLAEKDQRVAVDTPIKNSSHRLLRRTKSVNTAQISSLIAKRDGNVRSPDEQIDVVSSVQQAATAQRQDASRIEILTADPNIRIIWLTAKNTN